MLPKLDRTFRTFPRHDAEYFDPKAPRRPLIRANTARLIFGAETRSGEPAGWRLVAFIFAVLALAVIGNWLLGGG